MIWSLRHHRPVIFRSFLRMLAWLLPAAVLWFAGATARPSGASRLGGCIVH